MKGGVGVGAAERARPERVDWCEKQRALSWQPPIPKGLMGPRLMLARWLVVGPGGDKNRWDEGGLGLFFL